MSQKREWRLPAASAYIATLLGMGAYLLQAWFYAHTIPSVLDEGSYLYKGYLFASGQYAPYQDYGPWTNHMPLSFLIPGYIQKWFGTGLSVARAFSLALGILTLIGVWIIVRRFSGLWWAAAAVWMIALGTEAISIYSLASSQILVACMLVWILALSLGEAQPVWQLTLAGGLAGALWLTRINMAPVLLLLILYIFWQYDFKTAALVGLVGFGALALGHIPFWPNILKFWSKWLPRSVTPFLNPWRIPAVDNVRSWNPPIENLDRALSFLRAVKTHSVAVWGWLLALLIWPLPKQWLKKAHYKTAVFLFVLFATLFAFHAWASLGNAYCVDCLKNYMGFFSVLGVLLICIGFPNTQKTERQWMRFSSSIAILGLSTALAFSFTMPQEIRGWLLNISVPRVQSLRFLPGATTLGRMLENKFAFSEKMLKHILNMPAGFAIGVLLLLLGIALYKKSVGKNFSLIAASIFLAVNLVLSSAPLFALPETCGDAITANENVGNYLASVIPAGAQVYWEAGSSIVPMLYAPDVQIYLPQINDGYSFHVGGDADTLLKFGRWNADLAEQWREDADFILLDERHYDGGWPEYINAGTFDEITESVALIPCRSDSRIHVFRRIP